MAEERYPRDKDLNNDINLIVAAFEFWQAGKAAPEEFIHSHWEICQYLATRNREVGCPHPDVNSIDRMHGNIVSAVRITATLLEHGTSCHESIACFVAHVLGSVESVSGEHRRHGG